VSAPVISYVIATMNQSFINAAPQNDNELVLALAANTRYAFEIGIRYTNANSGITFQITFTVPALTAFVQVAQKCYPQQAGTGTGTGTPVGAPVANCTLSNNNNIDRIEMIGAISVGANAGNLQMQCRRTGGATDPTRLPGSYLMLQRL